MDAIEGTAFAWVEAIQHNRSWAEGRDASRIRAAFVTLAQTRAQWPAPRHFLEALPEPGAQLRLAGASERPVDPEWLKRDIAKHQVDYQMRRAQGGEFEQ